MDYQRKQRRIGVLIVILCLLIVVLWRMYSPTALQAYRYHREEAILRHVMQEIHPPPETATVGVQAMRTEGHVVLISIYSSPSNGESVKSHYIQEFARHGYTYQKADGASMTANFCAPGYRASLNRVDPTGPQFYFISINVNSNPC
jgi:hypothetical protein